MEGAVRVKIHEFTTEKLNMFRKECNFTDLELKCFNLKAKEYTNVQLMDKLHIRHTTAYNTMKSVRAKITMVLEEQAAKKAQINDVPVNPTIKYLIEFLKTILADSPFIPESHTAEEWAELPDKVSIKDKLYVVLDYRTDDEKPSVPRIKYGDGVTPVSKLPFCTAAITDNDVLWWDLKAQKTQ